MVDVKLEEDAIKVRINIIFGWVLLSVERELNMYLESSATCSGMVLSYIDETVPVIIFTSSLASSEGNIADGPIEQIRRFDLLGDQEIIGR